MPEPGPGDASPDAPHTDAPTPAAQRDVPHLTRGFLFADLRDYTSYVETHGDRAGASLLERYRALVRDAVAAAHGAEIKTEGDSFYVVFDSASAAVRCGQEIVSAANASDPADPIRVGVGIHAGETVETGDGYVGSAVNIAARLCAQAKAGELLVSETVRALTRTYLEVEFEPLGTRHLKGVNEQIAIYRVMPKGSPARTPDRSRVGMDRRTLALGAAAFVLLLTFGSAAVVIVGSRPPATVAPGGASSSPASVSSPRASTAGSSPAGSGSAATEDLGEAELALKARIPGSLEPSCVRSSLPDGSLGGSASLKCLPMPGSSADGADAVWYDQFDSGALLESAVNGVVARQHLTSGDADGVEHDCQTESPAVIGPWTFGFTFSGALACYTKDGAAWILWSYKGDDIAARAVRLDGDMKALYAWWGDAAGPFLGP
jgi:class 3 adenylate cyclase